ncbi:MAG: YifB family Mg chelatase-like AAA ATPase [Patescibacteria group bacterium]
MSAKIFTAAIIGLSASIVEVEADLSSQLPGIFIVGLPDKAVEEARERVRSALKNTGLDFPRNKVTVNLAPADLRKEGSSYDLPIAIALLIASGQLEPAEPLNTSLFLGELSLDGTLRPIPGTLAVARNCIKYGFTKLYVPQANAAEAALVDQINVYGIKNLKDLLAHLSGQNQLPVQTATVLSKSSAEFSTDLAEIKGQEQAKRALEIAAAGGHNILFSGPPGTGKTLLARALASILPPLDRNEILEVTEIYSITGLLKTGEVAKIDRPFRSPHHTASDIALVGGGSNPRPGEISLAHRGVLFLDEVAEFSRAVLENLRQPLESGQIIVSRAAGSVSFPAQFILVAAMNPCPCGFAGDPQKPCTCTPSMIWRYQRKLSGPILDRFDLHVEVPRVPFEKLIGLEGEASKHVQTRILQARKLQSARFKNLPYQINSEMDLKGLKEFGTLADQALELLRQAVNKFHLSARVYHRMIKVARTIADLAGKPTIEVEHLAEALQYRPRVHENL